MARLKAKGDLAELKVAADLAARGYRVLFPYGEDNDYDLVADTGDALHRVQVKYTESNGEVIVVSCRSHSLSNGRILRTKRYTSKTIECIGTYDRTSNRCYYIPASELGDGREAFRLRLKPTRNNQKLRVNLAAHYEEFPVRRLPMMLMEPAGFEPATSALQTRRSAS